jgi:hypothetical protein
MSNVVLPSQSFEEDSNNLVYSEADEIVVSGNKQEPNQRKKGEKMND